MKTDDESIKILEMRIQQQLNRPLEKHIELQNIRYSASSAMLQKELQKQNARMDGKTPAPQTDSEKPASDTKHVLQTGEMPPAIEYTGVSDKTKAQHIKGKNEYKRILHADEDSFGSKPFFSFKG